MTATVQSVGVNAPRAAETLISGKVMHRRSIQTQNGRLHLTLVRLPALDEYSAPSTIELRSRQSLGEVGDTIRVRATISGFPRQYRSKTPDDNGELALVRTAEIRLTVVEG